jgi:HTH-type transcriptional repressor of NAD biosynthesis genes
VTTGVVVGKFLPPHRGHSYLVESALAGADRVVVIVCARPDDGVPAERRAAALRWLHPAATVLVTPDDIADDRGDETSRAWAARTVELLGRPPDVVFTSESYGERYAGFLGARHVAVDPERRRFPVSGTAVRADPWRHRELLAPAVRAWFVRRVVVLGAESTGTTTLAAELAARSGCGWVPEYGREYCDALMAGGGTIDWRTGDFTHIATRQLADEDAAAERATTPLLICDTDALATSVWHERYLGVPSPAVTALAAARRYDLYVLTSDDIPFVQDGTRDGEHVRGWMTERFREVLAARPEPWLEVRGTRAERLAAVSAALDRVPPPSWPPASVADGLQGEGVGEALGVVGELPLVRGDLGHHAG